MTRSEIIANHIATLRASVSDGLRNHAQSTFAHAIYAALATPGCEAQGVRLADLPHLAERVAEMADAHEALRAERHDIPHHIRLALAAAQRAFDDRDLRVFGTFNEDLQPVVDAASAWITALSRDLSDARAEARAARAEVAALRAQVADLQRLGASIHKAAGAARRAERADVVAWLHTDGPALAFASCIGRSEYTCAADAIGRGEHEGAATPK